MTESWRSLHEAPREPKDDKPVFIRLFLPGVNYKLDENRLPYEISHGECVGYWNIPLLHWVNRDTHAKVYPSGWLPL